MFNKLGVLPSNDLLKKKSFDPANQQLINQPIENKPEESKVLTVANPFQLQIDISDSEKKVIGTEEVTFFKIDLQSNLTKREWTVYHRYSDFYELQIVFSKYYVHPPQLSLNQNAQLSTLQEAYRYKNILNTFLLEVISRPDLITSIYTIKFLQLENHYQDISLYQLYLLYHLKEALPLPVKCAYLYEETNLLLLALGELSSPNVITNTLSKLASNWSLGFKSSSSHSQGQLVIYNILKDHSGAHHFEPLYTKALSSVPCSINYFKEKNNLFIGMENGDIVVFKLYITESSSESKDLAEELNTIKIHKNPIIGVQVNFQQGYVYSFSRGRHMKVSELNYQSLMKDIPITAREVIIMRYDSRWGRVILSDDCGSLSIIDITSNPLNPQVVATIINNLTNITSLKIYLPEEFIVLGNQLGKCLFFKIRNYNQTVIKQEHLPCTTQIDIIKVKEINLKSCIAIRDIVINKKNEVFIALDNGSIAVYVHEEDNPEFVIDAHLSNISYMVWLEEKKVILTCSEDKTVKMLQMPLVWPSEYMRSNKGMNQQRMFDIERDVKKQNNYPLTMASSSSNSQIKKNPFYEERNKNDSTSGTSSSSFALKDHIDYTNTAAKFGGNIDLRSSMEGESKMKLPSRCEEKEGKVLFSKRLQITNKEKWSEDLDGWAL